MKIRKVKGADIIEVLGILDHKLQATEKIKTSKFMKGLRNEKKKGKYFHTVSLKYTFVLRRFFYQ
jgi:hypothetical protein